MDLNFVEHGGRAEVRGGAEKLAPERIGSMCKCDWKSMEPRDTRVSVLEESLFYKNKMFCFLRLRQRKLC